jgi:hypothetical protein
MPSALGKGIAKALQEIGTQEEVASSQATDHDKDALISEVRARLDPKLKQLGFWGDYCEDPAILNWAIEVYEKLRAEGYDPCSRIIDGKVCAHKDAYCGALFDWYVHCTEKWHKMTEEEKQAVIERSKSENEYIQNHRQQWEDLLAKYPELGPPTKKDGDSEREIGGSNS